PYLTFFTLLSVWAWVARVPLLTYVALGLAMIAKGPVIFITALSAIGAFQLLTASRLSPSPGTPGEGRGEGSSSTGNISHSQESPHPALSRSTERGSKSGIVAHIIGVALFAVIAVPWYLYIYIKIPHAIELWRYESIGEISDNIEKARPWWLYLGSMFRLPLPWTPLWIAGIALVFIHGKRGLRTPRGRRRLVPLIWFASNLI